MRRRTKNVEPWNAMSTTNFTCLFVYQASPFCSYNVNFFLLVYIYEQNIKKKTRFSDVVKYTLKYTEIRLSHAISQHASFNSVSFCILDVEPKFPYRDVTIKRGVDAKEYYELLEEIGR